MGGWDILKLRRSVKGSKVCTFCVLARRVGTWESLTRLSFFAPLGSFIVYVDMPSLFGEGGLGDFGGNLKVKDITSADVLQKFSVKVWMLRKC